MPATCPYPEQSASPEPRLSVWTFRNKICFYGKELLAPRPTPKLEDYTLSAVRNCFFNILAATIRTGGRSSIRNLRKSPTVVTGTELSRITVFKSIYRTKVTYFSRSEKSTHCFTSLNSVNPVKFIMVLLKICQYIRNHICIIISALPESIGFALLPYISFD